MKRKSFRSHASVNLLEGPILLALSRLALPIMTSSLLQMAYNLVDMIWIGRLGYQPVAAVGAASMFTWFGDGLLLLSRMGGQVYTGQALGRRDLPDARKWAVAALQCTLLIAVAYACLQGVLAPQLIGFFRLDSAETTAQGITYLRILGLGYPCAYLARMFTSLVTVDGRSRLSMWATGIGLVLNLLLDPLFIFTFQLGVAGAAWATILSQAVVFVAFLILTHKMELLHSLQLLTWEAARWKAIIRMGIPTAIQTMLYSSISMILGRMVSSFGSAAMSVQKVGSQIESISWMTAEGFGSAVTAFIAQNFGGRQMLRTRQGYYRAFLLMGSVGILTTCILCFCPGPIFQLFIPDPAVYAGGVSYLRILSYSQFFMCMEIMTTAAFSGLGKTLPPALIIGSLTFARIPLAALLTQTPLGVDGIWWAITISSIVKGIVLVILFEIYLRRTQRVFMQEVPL